MTARNWVFTINNYDQTELESLRKSLSSQEVRYAIFGLEVAKTTQTPHVQGYVSLRNSKRLTGVKKLVGDRARLDKAKGSEEHNFEYCSKDGKFEEFGARSVARKRTDLEAFKDAVKAGERNVKTLRENHSEIFKKYSRFAFDYIADQITDPPIDAHVLRDWQQELNQVLIHEPDDRQIIFVVDYDGNKGKSWFAKYYMSLHDNAFLLRPTKHADMAYALPLEMRVLFLDCTRKQVEYMPYTLMEELKDGYVFSNKYESRVKKYARLHVVVLMNQDPDMTALSKDRYVIKRI